MEKTYFCFLLEWADMFNLLTEEQCGALIKGMIAYEKDGIEPGFTDDILRFAWLSNIKPKMDALREHYQAKVRQTSEAGRISAEKRKQKKQMVVSAERNQQALTDVESVERKEHPSTNPTNIDLDIDIDLDKKENYLKEKEDVEFVEKSFSDDGMEVIKLYEERFGTVSTYKATQLDDLVKDFGKDAVAYAVRQANISSAPGIRYIRTTAMSFARRKEDGTGTSNNSSTVPNSVPKYGQGIVV